MPATVLITTPSFGRFSPEPRALLEGAGCEVRTPEHPHPLSVGQLRDAVRDADALIVGLDPVTDEVLAAAPRLRVVAKHGVGVDNIDVAAAARRGIRVVNAPATNTRAVADLAFALILACARQVVPGHAAVTGGSWGPLFGPELVGKTLGILGYGRIGREVARRAAGFDMRIIAHDPFVPDADIAAAGAVPAGLDECVAKADVLSLHLPAAPGAAPVLTRARLAAMRPHAILVNTARGGLVDETALAEQLHAGRLGAAGLDVYGTEPPSASPLLDAPRTVLTPHIGACTHEANRAMGAAVAADIVRVLEGREPEHPVAG
ncbi:phosphoglycerate dehydrogenase [Marinitenerispora sediminis]|uniref:Hydroxyacid dehydrogenase n=1 Tax=Marinitenerispora sediminis TaxID=1931232 RepID=A0A368T365_9ACTN|nr:phosphoglycerate dehydrogenase [Marinitenerispora sediminis]RCV48061.1 hydroxyacid dehydrogenase [Marinitenerispora sediminis]RCV49148.1 hydroxyacid dehydrogenase [Marinitenerispora sediminis]RCV51399.1 hydroxyacid dehydrogenase [Marinitenerispora sediminis]